MKYRDRLIAGSAHKNGYPYGEGSRLGAVLNLSSLFFSVLLLLLLVLRSALGQVESDRSS